VTVRWVLMEAAFSFNPYTNKEGKHGEHGIGSRVHFSFSFCLILLMDDDQEGMDGRAGWIQKQETFVSVTSTSSTLVESPAGDRGAGRGKRTLLV